MANQQTPKRNESSKITDKPAKPLPVKKRQNVRSMLIILTFLSLPVTQFYFSPYLIVWGASQGIITASFFTFAFLLFGSLFIGRAFCGWVMPCGGMQETLFQINDSNPAGGRLNYLKYVIWVPWIVSIAVLAVLAGGYNRVDYFFHLEHGISVSNVYMYIPYYIVIFVFFCISVAFGKRANCHYICWMSPFMIVGRTISNGLNTPALRIKTDNAKCVDCGACKKECQMGLDVPAMVRSGYMENAECILCGKCVDRCPKQAIQFHFGCLDEKRGQSPFSTRPLLPRP